MSAQSESVAVDEERGPESTWCAGRCGRRVRIAEPIEAKTRSGRAVAFSEAAVAGRTLYYCRWCTKDLWAGAR